MLSSGIDLRTAAGRLGHSGCGAVTLELWCKTAALACDLLAWTQMLALTGAARRWEPTRPRWRLVAIAGRLGARPPPPAGAAAERWSWAGDVTGAVTRLQALPSG